MYFKILGKLLQYVLVYYHLTMKCIRRFADNMQACIVLYIIYQSSPITDRSVIGMPSSTVWNPVGFYKEGTEREVVLWPRVLTDFLLQDHLHISYFSPVVINVLVWIQLGEGGKITRNKKYFRDSPGMYFLVPKFPRAEKKMLMPDRPGTVYSENTWWGCMTLRVTSC